MMIVGFYIISPININSLTINYLYNEYQYKGYYLNPNKIIIFAKKLEMTSIHSLHIDAIDGSKINFADFEGKKILIVNVASECGFTPQYQQLQELYETFKDKLAIIACPSNDFGGQEPGSHDEIQSFCTRNYGVTFPISAKIPVLGEDRHPLYQWLCTKQENGVMDAEVAWNFHKFLIDEKGILLNAFPSAVSPVDAAIVDYLNVGV